MTFIYQSFFNRKASLEEELKETLSVDGLVGALRIFQREDGHRHSIDDTFTAWYALQKSPRVTQALDLGTGIGTVGLAVLWGLGEDAHLTCIEAQDVSYKLLTANIECNGLGSRVTALHGDLRTVELTQKFPLITGSPPYFPADAGVLPSDAQKAHARFELRGHVGDYARAAKRYLEKDGIFVFCFPFQQKSRGIKLVEEVGFKIATARDIVPRRTKAPLFSVFAARLDWNGQMVEEPALIVTGENGRYTEEMLEVQKSRGFGPEGTNALQ